MAIIVQIYELWDKDHSLSEVQLGEKPLTIGRSSKCVFQLLDPKCSAKHLTLWKEQGIATARDEGSKNGTFLNENKLQTGHFFLQQKIQLGDTYILLSDAQMTAEEKKLHQRPKSSKQRLSLTGKWSEHSLISGDLQTKIIILRKTLSQKEQTQISRILKHSLSK